MANERTSEALATLEAGVKALQSSDDWGRYLAQQAKFHRYSFGNIMLIQSQKPDASQVAGFKTWIEMGRAVRKGEKAIWILAPRTFKERDDEDNETGKTRIYFRAAPVFDVSQTEGEDLPSAVSRLAGDDLGLFQRLRDVSEAPVTVAPIVGSANGFYVPASHTITVREGLDPAQSAKTLAHEIAHSMLHRDIAEYHATRPDCEMEAESVAFVVLAHFGIDAGAYSFGYIASWQQSKDAIKAIQASGKRIQQTAQAIIDAVEKAQAKPEPMAA